MSSKDGEQAVLPPPVEDPSTGETLMEVADAQVEDALAAWGAAAEEQAEWAAWAPRFFADSRGATSSDVPNTFPATVTRK